MNYEALGASRFFLKKAGSLLFRIFVKGVCKFFFLDFFWMFDDLIQWGPGTSVEAPFQGLDLRR